MSSLTIDRKLLDRGLVTGEQLQQARTKGALSHASLVQVLLDLGYVMPREMAEVLAELAGVPLVDMMRETVLADAVEWVAAVTLEACEQHVLMPYGRDGDGAVLVAMFDPTDGGGWDVVNQRLGTEWRPVVATAAGIQKALDRMARAKSDISGTIVQIIRQATPATTEAKGARPEGREDVPTIQLVNQLIAKAVELGASDIHFQPTESSLAVRMRIDGVLRNQHSIPRDGQSAILTRLKILAMMDVAEVRMPQDGRVSVEVAHRRVTLRVSTLPTQHGESVVLRILDANDAVQSLEDLGLEAGFRRGLDEMMEAPHGVVVVTGPTGSGKTTTLYAMLKHLNTSDTSIFTLEDPVEIPMAGIRQTQVREEIDLTWGKCLRALLRQDPDIILVGETRDRETADLMIRAALTGHLVFTTLHTNDAPGAIPRLMDMGVEPYLLPSSLVGVLAQRLVRRLCVGCRRPLMDGAGHLGSLGLDAGEWGEGNLHEAVGCPACMQGGYRGRQAVFEMMRMGEALHGPIMRRAAHSEFMRVAREGGMRTMFEDGMRHVMSGVTSLPELLRVVRPERRGAGGAA